MLPHWTTTNSALTATSYGTPEFPTVAESQRIGGGNVFAACGNSVASDDLLQEVPLHGLSSTIDSGHVRANLSVMLATFDADGDQATAYLEAFDGGQPLQVLLASVTTGALTNTGTRFVKLSTNLVLPKGTRAVNVDLQGTKNAGTYCDAYFDNVSVTLTNVP